MNPNFNLFMGSAKVHLGGDSRGRTGDLLNAIQALYQLSYTPADPIIISYFYALSKRFYVVEQNLTLRKPLSLRQGLPKVLKISACAAVKETSVFDIVFFICYNLYINTAAPIR